MRIVSITVSSAYNTGPENVAKAMTGTTKLKPTILPNKMSSKRSTIN